MSRNKLPPPLRGRAGEGGDTPSDTARSDRPAHAPLPAHLKENSKALRSEMTDAERALWEHLRAHRFQGLAFRRQAPMGAYIADFVCHSAKLVVELDGGQHAEDAAKDAARDAWFARRGYRVVRYWNNEALGNFEGVLEHLTLLVAEAASPPSPALPRKGGGGISRIMLPPGTDGEPSPLAGEGREGGETLSAKTTGSGKNKK